MKPTNWWFVDVPPFTKNYVLGKWWWRACYSPENQHGTQKLILGRWIFLWGWPIFRGYVSFGRVTPFKHQNYYKTSQFLKHHLTTKSFSMRILLVTINESGNSAFPMNGTDASKPQKQKSLASPTDRTAPIYSGAVDQGLLNDVTRIACCAVADAKHKFHGETNCRLHYNIQNTRKCQHWSWIKIPCFLVSWIVQVEVHLPKIEVRKKHTYSSLFAYHLHLSMSSSAFRPFL